LSIALVHPTAALHHHHHLQKWFHPRKEGRSFMIVISFTKTLLQKLCCKCAFLGSVKCVCVSSKNLPLLQISKEFKKYPKNT
jgi:hypothetical protein